MDNELNTSEAADIIETVERLAQSEDFELKRGDEARAHVLVVPKGKEVFSIKKYLDEYRVRPERRQGTARLTTLESFVEHVNRFKDGHSAIFADVTGASPLLVCVLDYNEPGAGMAARFGEHRAEFRFPRSKEWEAWMAAAKAPMAQAQFAEFLEDRLPDVVDPAGPAGAGEAASKLAELLGFTLATPQRLLELSRGLSVHVGHAVKTHVNLSTGEGQVSFEEKHADASGAPVKVPGGFAIAIPVFRGGVLYRLPVRLRYRVQDGKVTWLVSLQRAERAFDDAVNEAAATAQKSTELPLFYGTPESP